MAVARDQLTIVTPVLNEEEAVGLVLDEVKDAGYENVLVVARAVSIFSILLKRMERRVMRSLRKE